MASNRRRTILSSITLWTTAILLLSLLTHDSTLTVSAAPLQSPAVAPMAKMSANSPVTSVIGPSAIKKKRFAGSPFRPLTEGISSNSGLNSGNQRRDRRRRKRANVGNAPKGNGIANQGRTDGPLGR